MWEGNSGRTWEGNEQKVNPHASDNAAGQYRGELNGSGLQLASLMYLTATQGSPEVAAAAHAWMTLGGQSAADASVRYGVLAGLAQQAGSLPAFVDILNGRTAGVGPAGTPLSADELRMVNAIGHGSPAASRAGRTWEGSGDPCTWCGTTY